MRKNNKTKAEQLYYTYREMMFLTAYKILNSKELSEEAIQISFERIMKNLHKVDEQNTKKTAAFLSIICRNVALDLRKECGKRQENELLEEMPDFHGKDALDIITNKENLTRLLDCINSLRPVLRDVMVLKFYHDYENREIAKMLDITEETVRKRIERGRKELKNLLEKEAEKYETYR